MSLPDHLQIYTPGHSDPNQDLCFHRFSLLPAELRVNIWRLSLQRSRIIHIQLEPRCQPKDNSEEAQSHPFTKTNKLYRVVVSGCQILSKLLRVTRESRQEALRFYRVHVPCDIFRQQGSSINKNPGMLYFNPEHDFLHIGLRFNDLLVVFIHHLKTIYDSRHVGLLNLAIDSYSMIGTWFADHLRLSKLDSDEREAFVDTISNLQEIFFVSIVRSGRKVYGPVANLTTRRHLYIRSFPIMSVVPTFERLKCDPRPIGRDLKNIYPGSQLSLLQFLLWRKALHKWGIKDNCTEHRHLLAYTSAAPDPLISSDAWTEIHDRKSAEEFLRREEEEDIQLNSRHLIPTTWHEKFENEDFDWVPRPAFGFWLFPIGSFDSHPPDGRHHMLDVSSYWPEIGLVDLN